MALPISLHFVGNNEELNRPTHTIDNIIDHSRHDEKRDVTIYNVLPIVQNQVARRNYNKVATQYYLTQRYIVVLVYHCCNYVRAARTGVVLQGHARAEP